MTSLNDYLTRNGYSSVEEWALDSDFRYDKNDDIWYNDEGQPTDVEEYLTTLLAEGYYAS